MPPGTAVTVSSGSNTVNVSGLSAPVTVNGNQGGVNVSGVSGPLQVTTGSGSITGTALRSAAVQVTTDQGSADISFAAAPRSVDRQMLNRERNGQGAGNRASLPRRGQQWHRQRLLEGARLPAGRRVVQVSSGNGDATALPVS